MRVLQIHNAYKQAGGEDSVVAAEADLLRSHGNEVRLFGADNRAIDGPLSQLIAAWRAVYSVPSRQRLEQVLADWQPDVVHVHNLFPLLTPSVFDACIAFGVPTVMTLHNFRLVCPGALLFRQGRICEDCLGTSPWRAVMHRCYRGSLPGSLVVARMAAYHQRRRTWQRKVDRFIVMSEFARSKFASVGWEPERISVKSHFCRQPVPVENSGETRSGALFAGRLSSEKGLEILLAAWQNMPRELRLAGDGPMRGTFESCDNGNIHLLGWLSSAELSVEMAKAACLVVPSMCYESFGVVVIEAFARGLPVIASRIGALPELVEDGVTGLLFEPGNAEELAAKARQLLENPAEAVRMGNNAREVYAARYTPEKNYPQLLSIYQEAIDEKKADSRPRD